MTVSELIWQLEALSDFYTEDMEVCIWDPNSRRWEAVTGLVHGAGEIRLHSDDIS